MEKLELNNETILKYQYIVKRAALKLKDVYYNFDLSELESFGYEGLMDAIIKYDPSKSSNFEAYASQRVRGAITDSIRKENKLSRNVYKKLKLLESLRDEYILQHQMEPTLQELSKLSGISIKRLTELLQAHNINKASDLEKLDWQEAASSFDLPFEKMELYALREILIEMCNSLTEREKRVVELLYEKQLNPSEIADLLNCSESRVSQLKSKALKKLGTEKNKEKVKDFL